MRHQLIRSTVLAVGLAIAIILVPVAIAIWRASTEHEGLVVSWLDGGPSAASSLKLVALCLLLALVGLGVGVLVASRQARRLADPMTQLADRAERLGAGESRIQPMHSGILEVD